VNERQESLGKLVVARGDASEMLDAVEESFDPIAALIDVTVEVARIEPVGTRRDDGLAALRRDQTDEGTRVVALVGDDEFGRLMLVSAPACSTSAICPAESITRNGMPKASTAICSLVVSPPRERPICWPPAFFGRRLNAVGLARRSSR
jgi:hypothetical protein